MGIARFGQPNEKHKRMPPVNTIYTANDPPEIGWMIMPSEQKLYAFAGRASRWFAGTAGFLCLLGLYVAFLVLPNDPHYSEHYRILLIHIPAAWMAVLIYLAMAIAVVLGRVSKLRLFSMIASALAPTGAMFAFLALWTGSMWGKPTWGAWWIWDTNAVSALILLLLCLGFVAVQAALEDTRRADIVAGNVILAGIVALPLAYLSTEQWGGTRGSALSLFVPPGVVETVFAGVQLMTAGLIAYAAAVTLTRLRIVILERERRSEWVSRLAGG